MTQKRPRFAREMKREWSDLLEAIGPDREDLLWTMVRRLAKDEAQRIMRTTVERIEKIDPQGLPGEMVHQDVLTIIAKNGKLRRPRDPRTRVTPLAPGQQWTVALGTLDGRVRRADYRRYMKSPEWDAKRAWWWDRAGRPTSCAACDTYWSLQKGDLHHRTYERLGYEELDDLVQLCARCHSIVHANVKNWRDLEQVTDLVIRQIRASRRAS